MNDHDVTVYYVGWLIGHIASPLAILGALAGFLPPMAATIAFVWYVIQIGESATFRKWQSRRRRRKIQRLEEHLTQLRKQHDALERQDT